MLFAPCKRRSLLIGTGWLFIAAVAFYDSEFAWQNRESFAEWEQNPVMRWLAGRLGLFATIAFKAAALLFSLALAIYCHRHAQYRLEHGLVLVIGSAYLLLAGQYVIGSMGNVDHRGIPPARLAPASEMLSPNVSAGPIAVSAPR